MRKLLIATLTFLPLIAMAATPTTITLDVKNMTCATCPITVKKSLEKVSGVSTVKVDYGKKTATVTFDPDDQARCIDPRHHRRGVSVHSAEVTAR
jgi:mercuric ion binding protein